MLYELPVSRILHQLPGNSALGEDGGCALQHHETSQLKYFTHSKGASRITKRIPHSLTRPLTASPAHTLTSLQVHSLNLNSLIIMMRRILYAVAYVGFLCIVFGFVGVNLGSK